ncbi:hypothetical protein PPL_06823 [Heterostelium album PN500]|uniref:Uncharacterized protein n=1 Tax=Heterostelium pallidum (strain ATCC 26659 / Pp 5 / PN500) TaxID=670386 RepID=D3BDM1_HETP5|nr:hypothetical protein PPL_06823 [Heterostelium album PN500]EFA80002.1 hypothetical protein PPL_06823 [Heterostelium album PN500]|eukprot:XP_020432122.1 hypothetical protein PPL_06823 [Heterostelium album PN500]
MGGDIHLCSLILAAKYTLLLYIANMLGSLLSLLASIFNIGYYLSKRRRPFSKSKKLSKTPLLAKFSNVDTASINSGSSSSSTSYSNQNDINVLISTTSSISTYNKNEITPISTPTTRSPLNPSRSTNNNNNSISRNNKFSDSSTNITRDVQDKPKRINQLVFFLSLADFIACSTMLFSQTFTFCVTVRSIVHFGFLASFLWTNCVQLIQHINYIFGKFKTILSYGIFGSKSVELKRHIAKKLTLYIGAFLLCWVWDLINHTVFYIRRECPPYFLWVLQDLFSPSQVYAITNRN